MGEGAGGIVWKDLGAGEASVFRIEITHKSLEDSVNPSSLISIKSCTGELAESQCPSFQSG